MLKINALDINLREWHSKDFELIQFHKKRIQHIACHAGTGSDKFNSICSNLIDLVKNGNRLGLYHAIKQPVDIRAFSYLLSSNNDFVKKITITQELIDVLLLPKKIIGLLSLQQLIRAFFVYFDKLGSEKELELLTGFIKQQLLLRHNLSNDSSIGRWQTYSNKLFTLSGPEFVVNTANKKNRDLDSVFIDFSLTGFSNGQFQQVCRFYYYLEILKQVDPYTDHKILKEVIKPEVYNAPGLQGRLLGHAILSIMIDRIEGDVISDAWQKIILTIAGDPRVPKVSHKYQKWWMLLGDARITRVKAWLSRFDLNIFLEILEDFGHASGLRDLQRMYPARKKFLEGLIEHGLVSNSRLFLSRKAALYINNNYQKDEIPLFAESKGDDTSMIYLQVAHCHVVEGSHNFQIRIFPKYPVLSKLLDYSKTTYRRSELSNEVQYAYLKEFGHQAEDSIAVTHSGQLVWQHKVIQYLTEQGIKLDIQKLLTENDYAIYKRKFLNF